MTCEAPDCDRPAKCTQRCDGRSTHLCKTHSARWYQYRSFDLPKRPDRFPSAPIVQRVTDRGGPYRVCERGTRLWWMFLKARSVGTVSVAQADELAIGLLGEHPSAVWGDDWWDVA